MDRAEPLAQLLADGRPIVLDGGLATELETQGHDIGSALWSAALLSTQPDAIVAAHRAFLDAGAEIIISASYQASIEGFTARGFSEGEAEELIIRSVELACTARRQYCDANPGLARVPLVAASIGPYGAAMHDGSEYTGAYKVDAVELRAFHQRRLTLLERTNADLLACETIPNVLEAKTLASLLQESRLPAWISFCCRDEQSISDGTRLREVCALFRDHPRVLA
ncbi:MAG: homocysteine S-methyltransferase, partial [Woeseia sp.]